ncbi:hypothetical protein [Xanthomonas oryzae]|uniref:hypothetical protein n=1 Tax=Xanthomonas oryzae TaxID=347 RepID=UPI0011F0ACA8|nr:hypothetical protein [Xanthomonas oryzae]QGH67528.1 hypothetical protein GHV42_20065 [Xanthomonas oryzae pv. oryzicola]UBB95051.1 hypothetical protein K2I41_20220 [Xanthomonas oryzae pv. oryzicola]WGY44676.1 hypothetical protein HED68_19905 [Xanthomonas oryzae pv. oryzicola]
MLSIAIAQPGRAEPAQPAACSYDRTAMLALDQDAFDQDLQGGWRTIADRPGCTLAAADLLRDYRQAHAITGGIVVWHEGQMRAEAGQTAQAIALFEKSYKPAAEDLASWNRYVDAMIAFLKRDRASLDAARARLAVVPYPKGKGMPPLQDGYMVLPATAGHPEMRVRWPPNLDVVDGLIKCYDASYSVAYGSQRCRTSTSTLSK